ncbi:P2X purinoceptor 7-like [Mytilus trossulus]|uniref:P2X purinoceptor 7-like n=1 Tax=Mytilus trossulus TaxID=6551 RepID=UPI003004FBF1
MDFDGQDSGDEPFITAVDNIQPYQFEPVVHIEQNEVSSQNQSDSSEENSEAESDSSDLQDSRMDNLAWCDCNHCAAMPTVDECLCCKEVGPVAEKMEDEDLDCITDHEGFTGNCLNRHVIEVSLYDFVERQGPIDDNEPIHELYRYVAYRRFTRWIWHILGKKRRKVIPACAVLKIREAFPSEDFTGFKYARP